MRIAILLSALALGAAQARAEHGLIKDNDKDGDTKLSWAEVEPIGWSKEMFELKDMDGDGFLSEKDLMSHVEWLKTPAVNPKIIQAMDGNGDGKVQKDEWWWGDEFAGYDLDQDGALDDKELAKLPKASQQRKPAGKAKKAKKQPAKKAPSKAPESSEKKP